MTDVELASAWESGELGRPVSHLEHVRVAVVLIRRHGADDGERRLVDGTLLNCRLMDAAERFDEDLTRRWARVVAEAIDAEGASSADELLRCRPELARGDLLGAPSWKHAAAADGT